MEDSEITNRQTGETERRFEIGKKVDELMLEISDHEIQVKEIREADTKNIMKTRATTNSSDLETIERLSIANTRKMNIYKNAIKNCHDQVLLANLELSSLEEAAKTRWTELSEDKQVRPDLCQVTNMKKLQGDDKTLYERIPILKEKVTINELTAFRDLIHMLFRQASIDDEKRRVQLICGRLPITMLRALDSRTRLQMEETGREMTGTEVIEWLGKKYGPRYDIYDACSQLDSIKLGDAETGAECMRRMEKIWERIPMHEMSCRDGFLLSFINRLPDDVKSQLLKDGGINVFKNDTDYLADRITDALLIRPTRRKFLPRPEGPSTPTPRRHFLSAMDLKEISEKIGKENPGAVNHPFSLQKIGRLLNHPKEGEARRFLSDNNACTSCRMVGRREEHGRANGGCPYFDKVSYHCTSMTSTTGRAELSLPRLHKPNSDNETSPDCAMKTQMDGDRIYCKEEGVINVNKKGIAEGDEYDHDDWTLNTDVANRLFEIFYTPQTDIFASSKNKKAESFFQKETNEDDTDGNCLGTNALKFSWKNLPKPYANPPWSMLSRVINKVRTDKVDLIIIIAPICSPWKEQLEDMSRRTPLILPRIGNLFTPVSGSNATGKPPWGETAAYLITGLKKKSYENTKYTIYKRLIVGSTTNRIPHTELTTMASENDPTTGSSSEDATELYSEDESDDESIEPEALNPQSSMTWKQTSQNGLGEIPIWDRPGKRCHFIATFNNEKVIVLRDCGAAGNFVNPETVKKFGWTTVDIEPQIVSYGGSKAEAHVNKGVVGQFKKNNYVVEIALAVAPISEDIILGTSWENTIVTLFSNLTTGKFQFRCKRTMTKHTWYVMKKQNVLLTPMNSIQEIINQGGQLWSCHLNEVKENIEMSAMPLSETIPSGLPLSIQKAVNDHLEIFGEPNRLPPKRNEDMEIKLDPKTKIPNRPLQQMSQQELQSLRIKLDELLAKQWIRPSSSPYGSAVIFARKKDGTLRMCIDYRGINNATRKDKTPTPSLQQIREQVQGAKFLTKLDIRDAFHMIRIKEDDCEKTAFKTRFGLYEFTVVPFGLCNSPATFIKLMNRIFHDIYDKYVIIYVDDIIIYSSNEEEHGRHVHEVLKRLKENQLFVKLNKCQFQQTCVDFGGMSLSTEGIAIHPDSIEAVTTYPLPTNRSEVQSFLGLTNFLIDYIPRYHEILYNLTELTKKTVPWSWGTEETTAIRIIQAAVTRAPVLCFFDPQRTTQVWSDASLFAVGGWVGQEYDGVFKPCFYFSRKLKAAETRYPTHDRELLAVIKVCKKFAVHLKSVPFIMNVDHRAFEHLQSQPNLSPRQARWIEFLQEFDMKFKYLKGELNTIADFLSRRPDYQTVCGRCKVLITKPLEITSMTTLSTLENTMKEFILKSYENDELTKIVMALKDVEPGRKSSPDKTIISNANLRRLEIADNGLIYYHNGALYIPEEVRMEILRFFHDQPAFDHHGTTKTLAHLRERAWWPSMIMDIDKWVRSCHLCQVSKHSNQSTPGMLHPLPIPSARFEKVTMDFAELPQDKSGNDFVLIIVDRLTKLTKIIPCRKSITAEQTAHLFLTHWVLQGKGIPNEIISDRDTRFTSILWQEICESLGIRRALATSRHQQTDGQSEIAIKILKEGLSRFLNYAKNNWVALLPYLEHSINSLPSTSTGFSPYYLAYSIETNLFPFPDANRPDDTRSDLLSTIESTIQQARMNIFEAQEKQRAAYNKRRRTAPSLTVGDQVLVKREGINWDADSQRSAKAKLPFLGPFPITNILQNDNIEVKLPIGLHIHPVFHTSNLMPYIDPRKHFPQRITDEHPGVLLDGNGDPVYEIDTILDTRIYRKKRQWLIQWKGYGAADNLWTPDEDVVGRESIFEYYQKSGKNPPPDVRIT